MSRGSVMVPSARLLASTDDTVSMVRRYRSPPRSVMARVRSPGGHAVMYDFPDSEGLQRITREIYERGDVVASVCHGYCGLLNTQLSDGSYLIAGKHMTGFAWQEEAFARVDKLVPYNAEERAKVRGALYEKAKLPFVSYTVVDGNLVTGQNPGSAKETAKKVAALLTR